MRVAAVARSADFVAATVMGALRGSGGARSDSAAKGRSGADCTSHCDASMDWPSRRCSCSRRRQLRPVKLRVEAQPQPGTAKWPRPGGCAGPLQGYSAAGDGRGDGVAAVDGGGPSGRPLVTIAWSPLGSLWAPDVKFRC